VREPAEMRRKRRTQALVNLGSFATSFYEQGLDRQLNVTRSRNARAETIDFSSHCFAQDASVSFDTVNSG